MVDFFPCVGGKDSIGVQYFLNEINTVELGFQFVDESEEGLFPDCLALFPVSFL